MNEKKDQIDELLHKLETLLERQESFSREVDELRDQLIRLKETASSGVEEEQEPLQEISAEEEAIKEEAIRIHQAHTQKPSHKKFYRDVQYSILGGVCSGFSAYLGVNRFFVRLLWLVLSLFFGIGFLLYIVLWIAIPKDPNVKTGKFQQQQQQQQQKPVREHPKYSTSRSPQLPKMDIKLEKFIGENIISKIGIVIIIIGVAIGTKYSIEHDLISPLTRVILGYLVGLGLLGFGIRLKKKYKDFSAVLVSGAIAVLYFMTYAAYSFYDLFPQTMAFVLMVVFTVFTVIAALAYNNQIIAHIGLVGAYAVPFLLSENSDNATVLFSYMTIINIGILAIAFKKYWKELYFLSFGFTWLIFISWYVSNFNAEEDFSMAFTFAFLFFVIYYTVFLAFKLLQKEKFGLTDILLLIANSFIFYGIGYGILNSDEIGEQLLGAFTLGNAIVHFLVSVIIYKQKLADKNLFYLVSGLVLVFITIAIPVQLDGNWVTLLWVGLAALLFWIGRTKAIPVYEYISYPLMVLAALSLYQDWSEVYNNSFFRNREVTLTPLLNIQFLSSLLFIGAFGFIYWLHTNKKYTCPLKQEWLSLVSFLIPAVFLTALYGAFRLELESYWYNLFNESQLTLDEFDTHHNYDLLKFKTIWVINYSLLFVSVLSFLNILKLRDRSFGMVNLILNFIAIVAFLTLGLYELSELRETYVLQPLSDYYEIGSYNIWIRYISYAFLALTLFVSDKYLCQTFMKVDFKMVSDLVIHISIIWIASSELINIMDLSGSSESYKLGLSILWGVYSLILIAYGIWKNKKHLRIGAIALFSVTLIKLFFYDISHLKTISKTVVFLSLGILLLIISFLYNKFKHKITDDIEK